jgi:hypothetical protein
MCVENTEPHPNGNDRREAPTDVQGRDGHDEKAMASELLRNLAQAITPPPPPPLDDEYDGLEYSWKYFVFRPACESIHFFQVCCTTEYAAPTIVPFLSFITNK